MVVMLGVGVGLFVTGLAVAEPTNLCEARFREQLHGAVHGGQPHTRVFSAHTLEELIDGEVTFDVEESRSDQFSLPTVLHPVLGEKRAQRVLAVGLHLDHDPQSSLDFQGLDPGAASGSCADSCCPQQCLDTERINV